MMLSHSKMVNLSSGNKGFTLIEVLIAAVILFSALAITAELYAASSLSASKASNRANFYQVSPIAINAIKVEIRHMSENRSLSEFSNEVTISGIRYQWQAQRTAFKARVGDIDDLSPPLPQFGLFSVTVFAKDNSESVGNTNKISEFQFEVATW